MRYAPVRAGAAHRWALFGRIHTGGAGRRTPHANTPALRLDHSENGAASADRHRASHGCARLPRRAPPSARWRARRRTAGGGCRNWRGHRARSALCNATPPIRKLSPGATAPRACRLRVGVPARWPGRRRSRMTAQWCALRPARTPSARGGRGDGLRATGGGTGGWASRCGQSATRFCPDAP